MIVKLAAPLFILRQEAEQDLFDVLEKLSALGFEGVEFLGFFGKEVSAIREKMDSLSMTAVGNHVNVHDLCKEQEKVIMDHVMLGCRYITIAWPDPAIQPGSEQFDGIVQDIRRMARLCCEKGITPLYHNHDYEFRSDPPMLDIILEACEEDGLRLEPDLGWMAFMQVDPAVYLRKYIHDCPVIHLKDIYAEDLSLVGEGAKLGTQKENPEKGFFEFRPTGYGIVNMPKLMPLCLQCKPEWMVLDHDLAYNRDSYADLKLSLDYTRSLLALHI